MTADPMILPLGPDGVLVRFADRLSESANRAALAFRAAFEADRPAGVTETASSLTSVLVRFRPDLLSRAALQERLAEDLAAHDWRAQALPGGRRLWHLPASFGGADGPQLEEAAGAAGRDPDAAVAEITSATLRVLALGFAPGQPYLGFLPAHWDIPRQTGVTPEVPRGAVVVAVRQVIPFAHAAPTGWRQIGRTAFRCHDPAGDPPIPLRAGDEVRLHAVSAGRLAELLAAGDARGGAEAEPIS